jgi:pyruvate dehydrogenase E2 component (dihydrolipoamide acetyltransferase)
MPVAEGDVAALDRAQTRIRLMLPVIVAFDHRLIDGADAARFVKDFAALMGSLKDFAVQV